jgi:hypothetical protein
LKNDKTIVAYFVELKKIPMVGSLIYHGQKFLLGYPNIDCEFEVQKKL